MMMTMFIGAVRFLSRYDTRRGLRSPVGRRRVVGPPWRDRRLPCDRVACRPLRAARRHLARPGARLVTTLKSLAELVVRLDAVTMS